jgi:hypothetical protein
MRYPNPWRVTKSAILAVTRYIPEDIGKLRKTQGNSNDFSVQEFPVFPVVSCYEQGLQNRGLGVRVPPLLPAKSTSLYHNNPAGAEGEESRVALF